MILLDVPAILVVVSRNRHRPNTGAIRFPHARTGHCLSFELHARATELVELDFHSSEDTVELGDVARAAVVGRDGENAQHCGVVAIGGANVGAHSRKLEIQQAHGGFHRVEQIRRAALEHRVQLCARAASHHERIGAVAAAVSELHRSQRIGARHAVAIRLVLLESVLAQHLIEGDRLLGHVVGVIRLLDDCKGGDHRDRDGVGQQLSPKGRTRNLRLTQFLDRLAGRRDQIFLSGSDESRIERILGERQIHDRLGRLRHGAPVSALERSVVEDREFAPVDLQRIAVLREGEHQPLGARTLYMAGLDARREYSKGQGLAARPPVHRGTRDLDMRERPGLLRLIPQREYHRPTAQSLAPALASEHIRKLDIAQKRLRLSYQIVDHLVPDEAAALDDDLFGRLFGVFRLRNGNGDLALLFLGRAFFAGR